MTETVTITLEGNLSAGSLSDALKPLGARLEEPAAKVSVVFDVRTMTGYDVDARHAFVDWHRRHKDRVRAVAIVTDNSMWHVVISAMSLASGQQMKPFSDPSAAQEWLSRAR
ncbi:MAG: STAS/SEC14 domain-containing protein [Deltaproteobacteria bacterium]|nr:STAS/SEC14 domain-containing protein [Deltaproteobacteria bacterium]